MAITKWKSELDKYLWKRLLTMVFNSTSTAVLLAYASESPFSNQKLQLVKAEPKKPKQLTGGRQSHASWLRRPWINSWVSANQWLNFRGKKTTTKFSWDQCHFLSFQPVMFKNILFRTQTSAFLCVYFAGFVVEGLAKDEVSCVKFFAASLFFACNLLTNLTDWERHFKNLLISCHNSN